MYLLSHIAVYYIIFTKNQRDMDKIPIYTVVFITNTCTDFNKNMNEIIN